jgi:uncharacterized YccA/Bax inhibitor family protein
MPNPALNDRTFDAERVRAIDPRAIFEGADTEPWRTRMTLDGVIVRCLTLFPILLATGWFGWRAVDRTQLQAGLPVWVLPVLLGAFGLAVLTVFKPRLSPYTAPVYAAGQGLAVGAVSGLYNARFEGIVLQAVMLTVAVFAIMLGLYTTRLVRVTDRMRRVVIVATLAVMAVYLVSIAMRLFGASVPMIHENGAVGILFSLAVVGIASFNLLLDFDLIEKGVASGAPKWMEWYAAFALFVTLVWLYLELLRLLAKLRSR